MQKYEEMFPAFTDSRECKLVKVSGSGDWVRVVGGVTSELEQTPSSWRSPLPAEAAGRP